MKNHWKYVSAEYKLLVRYYKPDGSLMGEIEDQIVTKPEWETFWHTRGWGWEKSGNWPLGVYCVEVLIDYEHRITGEFTIFEDQAEKPFAFQPLPFTGNDDLLSEAFQRRFAPDFPKTLGRNQRKAAKGEDAMTEKGPKGLGFEGWLNRLSQQFPSNTKDEKFDPNQPLDDMAKMRWLMAIDGRYTWTMPRTQTGLANEKVLQDLKEIAADYQKLLQAGPPQFPFYTEEGLRMKIADVLNSAAQACDTLRDYPQASQHYTAAAKIYTALGKHEQAQRCHANLTRLKFAQDGDVNYEIKRLRTELTTLSTGSVAYAETLVELAGLYSSNGDDYEAEKLLLEAEKVLDRIGGDPSGSDLAAALTQSLLSVMQGQHGGGPTAIETKMKVNGLYRELSLALARIYETTEPLKAANYRAKATQRDNRANNDEFSEYMRRALDGDLGKV
jgi:tetratricopeptide (TPR) repeat protein